MNYKGEIIEKKNRIRILISDIEGDEIIEVSAVISKAETSLRNRIFYERHSEYRLIYGNLADLLYNSCCASRFKISIGSTNLLNKEYLDDILISIATTKATTDISDTRDNLEVEDNLANELFKQLDSVIDEVIASAAHARNDKSISTSMLSKI